MDQNRSLVGLVAPHVRQSFIFRFLSKGEVSQLATDKSLGIFTWFNDGKSTTVDVGVREYLNACVNSSAEHCWWGDLGHKTGLPASLSFSLVRVVRYIEMLSKV